MRGRIRAPKTDTAIRKRQIVQAAVDLVAERGLAGLNVAELARRVGLSAAGIYRHFAGKEEILDSVVNDLDLNDLEVVQVEDVGDPARMLLEYSRSVSADLMVIGRRGAGLIERIMLGSVANRIVHDADCPVLLVP